MTQFETEKWANKLNSMLSKGITVKCTNTNYTGEIKNLGDTVICKDDSSLVIDQKKFFAFKVNNMEEVQASKSIMEAHLKNATRVIEEVKEQFLCSLHNLVSADHTVGSETEPIQIDKKTLYRYFVELALKLKSQPENSIQRPWVIINPLMESYLLQTPEFINKCHITDPALRQGAIGRIAGMDVLVTFNGINSKDGKYYILAGTNEAITCASHLDKIENLRDRDSFSDLVRGIYLYGAKIVAPKALAKMIVTF